MPEKKNYILTKNNSALLILLQANPDLMAGDDPLAQELRAFMSENMQTGLLWFSAPTATLPPPELELSKIKDERDGEIY